MREGLAQRATSPESSSSPKVVNKKYAAGRSYSAGSLLQTPPKPTGFPLTPPTDRLLQSTPSVSSRSHRSLKSASFNGQSQCADLQEQALAAETCLMREVAALAGFAAEISRRLEALEAEEAKIITVGKVGQAGLLQASLLDSSIESSCQLLNTSFRGDGSVSCSMFSAGPMVAQVAEARRSTSRVGLQNRRAIGPAGECRELLKDIGLAQGRCSMALRHTSSTASKLEGLGSSSGSVGSLNSAAGSSGGSSPSPHRSRSQTFPIVDVAHHAAIIGKHMKHMQERIDESRAICRDCQALGMRALRSASA